MKMRPGDSACCSYFANYFSFLHIVSFLHMEFGKMCKIGIEAETVIKNNSSTSEVEILNQNNLACIRRFDGCSLPGTEISSAMGTARLPINNTPLPEAADWLTRNRSGEWPVPEPFLR